MGDSCDPYSHRSSERVREANTLTVTKQDVDILKRSKVQIGALRMNDWINALLPVIGIVIGASLQFWLSRAAEKNKHLDTLRAEAYADYLRAVAASAHLTSDQDLVEALRLAANAKTRILVYGTNEAIAALAKYEATGPVLNNERSVAAFVALVSAMRSSKGAISERDIKLVLLGAAQQGDQETVAMKSHAS